jgi:hypothetical protein
VSAVSFNGMRFKQSRIRSAVFDNSRQFFIMRQNPATAGRGPGRHGQGHRAAGSHAARDYEFPVARPPDRPEGFTVHLPAHRRRTESVWHGPQRCLAGDALLLQFERRVASPARTFDRRARELRRSPSVVEGIRRWV